jgi:cytochrome c peroxidase
MKNRGLLLLQITTLLLLLMVSGASAALTPVQHLGKILYFDQYLSLNQNQACASCHHPSARFADPLNLKFPYDFPVSLGSDPTLNGGRNAPTAAYAAFTPVFAWNNGFSGGQFWDGRANSLKDQAKGPFLNPVEMGMADEAAVIGAIADPGNKNFKLYLKLFWQVYGINLRSLDTSLVSPEILAAYDKTAEAIASFEQTCRFTSFSSKYDYYLAGQARLSAMELRGLEVFENPALGNCAACHPNQARVLPDGRILPPLFTDFTYDNLGVPKNLNPLIADNPVDYGLGARSNLNLYNPALSPELLPDGASVYLSEAGKFRVSSLRNTLRTAPYSHNGYFATLEEIVHFYNTRDVAAENWAPPEVALNVNMTELGNLGLSPQQEADLVAFIRTLTDGYGRGMPPNFVLPEITALD